MLSDNELERAREIVNAASPGIYEVSQLYGNKWLSIPDPQAFGIRFKASVQHGQLSDIRLHGKTVTNHHLYSVK